MQPPSHTCVILAAGASRRMGLDKLTHLLPDGSTLLARALHACRAYPTVVVVPSALSPALDSKAGVVVVTNDEPGRGMTHSVRLADATISPERSIVIVPADLPFFDDAVLRDVIDASANVDVCFPVRLDGTPGHPVVFSPAARRLLEVLPEGDTLRELRDRAGLSRRVLSVDADAPYLDVDTPEDLARLMESR